MNSISVEYTSLKIPKISNYVGGDEPDNIKSIYNMNLGGPLDKNSVMSVLIIIVLIVITVYIILRVFKPSALEHMSGGTLTQLFAQDAQNTNLNSASPGIQSNDFNLFWNQPTRIAQGTQRGTPLKQIALPNTAMSPKKNQENKIKPDKPAFCTMENPEGCGNGAGNLNYLSDGFVEPANPDPTEYVGLDGKIMYPNGYVGSLWLSPQSPGNGTTDVMKPLPITEKQISKTSKPYLPYVREGYK